MSFLKSVTDQLNLRWAWEKVRRTASPGDVWVNEAELAGFEVNLERELQSIATDIARKAYRLRPLRPMAFPKNRAKDGQPQARQYFHVAIRDQVAWMAIVNVIGPYLDNLMPPWSYGNRLFRSIWVEEDPTGIKRRKIGKYRHTSGRIYLPFGQSWPVFRRHVFLTTAAMSSNQAAESPSLAEEDLHELNLQEQLHQQHRCPFVQATYWEHRRTDRAADTLFWCSIDLEKFYPSLKLGTVLQTILNNIPSGFKTEAEDLLSRMLLFTLDTTGWSASQLKQIGLRSSQRKFDHIPTGLYVAGFLANVGMLRVDQEVARRLAKNRVAHFRYVDDHVILTHSFDELFEWVEQYLNILDGSDCGAHVNPDKIEPPALAELYRAHQQGGGHISRLRKEASEACKLNPEFPAPLMTRTLALVSAIARTDLDLLEQPELTALSDQLEHMLLVPLPETEIPEKTRLSFAATKLIRVAECRLSSDSHLATLGLRSERTRVDLVKCKASGKDATLLKEALGALEKEVRFQRTKLEDHVWRAFTLLRKVLQEKPDRVRLWTRAIQMCRQTGVRGLAQIRNEIVRLGTESGNELAAEYLMANTLALIGSEAITAARVLTGREVAEWRKYAARSFLEDVSATKFLEPPANDHNWHLHISWLQYCFGLFCAKLILESSEERDSFSEAKLPADLIEVGKSCLSRDGDETALNWAWWAVRRSLVNLSPDPERWVVAIGERLNSESASVAFWRFFPGAAPEEALRAMKERATDRRSTMFLEGWWYDAVRVRTSPAETEMLPAAGSDRTLLRIRRNHLSFGAKWVSMPDWVDAVEAAITKDVADPRGGEWTALEFVRQIAAIVSRSSELGIDYLRSSRANPRRYLCLHPANFRIPRKWLDFQGGPPTWTEWRTIVQNEEDGHRIEFVPENERITDFRYTPLSRPDDVLFETVNYVRGLGLLLYGLLRHSFSLPAIWNAPGHADVLNLLPKLLLSKVTCSSLTLGVLQGCLQSRALENLYLLTQESLGAPDSDVTHDPVRLRNADEVRKAVASCQDVLERNQLSTIHHRARQLTPISVRQLSNPVWSHDFGLPVEGAV